MRPDKPGYWWYTCSSYGPERIAKISSGFSYELCVIENQRSIRISLFECSADFGEWLGQAYPPKKVNRYSLETEYGSGGPTTNKEMVENNVGKWVKYDNVKEYDIAINR